MALLANMPPTGCMSFWHSGQGQSITPTLIFTTACRDASALLPIKPSLHTTDHVATRSLVSEAVAVSLALIFSAVNTSQSLPNSPSWQGRSL